MKMCGFQENVFLGGLWIVNVKLPVEWTIGHFFCFFLTVATKLFCVIRPPRDIPPTAWYCPIKYDAVKSDSVALNPNPAHLPQIPWR